MSQPEKKFEESLKNWLEQQGILPWGTEVESASGYWNKRWGGSQYIKAGLPDMQIVVGPYCIEAELKGPSGRPSELQKQKLRQVNRSGGIGFVLYPKDFEAFKRFVLELKGGRIDRENELFKGRLL